MKIRLVEGPDDDKLQGLLNRSITNQKLDDAEEADIGDSISANEMKKRFEREVDGSKEQAFWGRLYLIHESKLNEKNIVNKLYDSTNQNSLMNAKLFCGWLKAMTFDELENPNNKFVKIMKTNANKDSSFFKDQKVFFGLYNAYARDDLDDIPDSYFNENNSVIYDSNLYNLDKDDIERYIKYDQLENTKGPDGKSKLLYNKDGKLRKPSQVENSAEANGLSVESNSRNLKSIWEKRGDKEVADMIRAMLKSERGAKIIKNAIDNNK